MLVPCIIRYDIHNIDRYNPEKIKWSMYYVSGLSIEQKIDY